jgi:glutaredoxin
MDLPTELQRRREERRMRQSNLDGQTTMISPLARLMTASLRKTTDAQRKQAELFVEATLADDHLSPGSVLIFAKSHCPRCHDAVALFSSENLPGIHVTTVNLDQRFDSENDQKGGEMEGTTLEAVQDVLWDRTGCRTVPRIFAKPKDGAAARCLGGFDDVLELRETDRLLLCWE